MNYKNYNDYELIYMVRENDDDSKDILFKKYDPIIRNIVNEYYNNFSIYGYAYDDFYQEALVSFQRAILVYDENKDSLLYSFIILCVRRNLQSFCRNISTNKSNLFITNSVDIDDCSIEDVSSEISNHIDYLEFQSICKKVIYNLPSLSSAILELKLNGFTYREIGILLDIPSSSVEFRSRRGRNILRKNLKRYYCK